MSPIDLLRDRRGSIAVEAALVLSLCAAAALAAFDASRYLQTLARAERLAANIADMAARAETLRDRTAVDANTGTDDVGMYFMLARLLAEPADLTDGGVMLSSVSADGAAVSVHWTRAHGAVATGAAPRVQDLAPLPEGADFIVAEVMLPFETTFLAEAALGIDGSGVVAGRALYRSRSADLRALVP